MAGLAVEVVCLENPCAAQQINILVPLKAPAGTALPLVLTIGGVTTQTGVTIGVQQATADTQ